MYVVANVTVTSAGLNLHDIMPMGDDLQEAVLYVREQISQDFGYTDWDKFVEGMNPEIDENPRDAIYKVTAGNDEHTEGYIAQWV